MANQYRIDAGQDPYQVMSLLEDKLYAYNMQQVQQRDGQLFSRVINSEEELIIAGIAGWTWAGICEITQLWVDAAVRGQGLAKILLDAAEKEADSRGCHTILVRSFSFQAPRFYQKHGYITAHMIKDFPVGHVYYILIKKLL